jgi:hypothetical protein
VESKVRELIKKWREYVAWCDRNRVTEDSNDKALTVANCADELEQALASQPAPSGLSFGQTVEMLVEEAIRRYPESEAKIRRVASAGETAVRLTLEDAIYILAYAAEGRMNTIKPDLLANIINKLIAQRASAAPPATERGVRPSEEEMQAKEQIVERALAWYADDASDCPLEDSIRTLMRIRLAAAAQPTDKEAGK